VEEPRFLAGRYRLVERLGQGGMSVVWRAYDEVLGRLVAVKTIRPDRSATDPASRERIRAEARAAARLSHPFITNVYDYGECTAGGGEPTPFVVMELVEGEPLDERLDRERLSPAFAVEVCAQVAAALGAVHARGLVHRDVKPANVMLTPDGAKVVDFGISAVAGDNPDTVDRVMGTPAYLAPERLDGGPADAASDMYALGLLLYKTLTGRLPWDADTTTQMLVAHCYLPPTPLPRIPDLSSEGVHLVHRCLA
jgi:eukaryotic-like serine/threonine-protein kinase